MFIWKNIINGTGYVGPFHPIQENSKCVWPDRPLKKEWNPSILPLEAG